MTGSQPARVETCDVCIVGAGIAGLNALFAASRYQSRDQKVILIDRRARVGGMWVDVYSYVRLHQPHPMFTAGNIEWTLGKDRAYLATKGEVLDHFQHCVDVIRERVQVDEYFGWDFESEEEANGIVRVTCRAADGRVLVVDAKRLIKAYGLAVTPNEPLDISSKRVHSVSPDYCDVRGGRHQGKRRAGVDHRRRKNCHGHRTCTDHGISRPRGEPGRRPWNVLLQPRQSVTERRPAVVEGHTARHRRRTDGGGVSTARTKRKFKDWFRATYGTFLTPQADNFALGVLSEAENRTISAGLNDLVMDYLEDAVDRNGTTELVFRSGSTKEIQPGSWVVNCTGYVGLIGDYPYEPYVSPSGAVVSINVRSAILHLPAFMGYFLGHLLFLDKIRDVPLYEVDWQELRHKSPVAFPYVLFALVQHNLSLIYENVPSRVFNENGLDFDKWYPLPRRLPGLARFLLTHRRERERQRRVLDTVHDRFGIRCGPLSEEYTPSARS